MSLIYILRLQNEKYYVGKTSDIITRWRDHVNGTASVWTKKYKPIKIVEKIPSTSDFDEDKYTKIYMARYGLDNVRGGSYTNLYLSDAQNEILQREIWSAQDKCIKCGRNGHFANDCNVKDSKQSFTRIPYYLENSDSSISSEESSEDFDEKCFRCGRPGHYISECYAKRDVRGYYIR